MICFKKIRIDKFTLSLVFTVIFSTFFPVHGGAAEWFDRATSVAVALLFFLHGVNLSREAMTTGVAHWRLHVLVLMATFVLFPLLGLLIQWVPSNILSVPLATGLLYLCCLPSTVQSSIAFTSIARGNVPAAICAASFSNLLGVFMTPLMVGVLIHARSAVSFDALESICLQILLPFGVGQFLHPRLGAWAKRHKPVLGVVDRGSILMVVYGAFSAAVIHGIWTQLPFEGLVVMTGLNFLLLGAVLWITYYVGGVAGFNREDKITLMFCGSKKSLASGVPMANILFPAHLVGPVVLPLMLFHQIQLMVCAYLARGYAAEMMVDQKVKVTTG